MIKNVNKAKKKAQAMIEYILIVFFTAMAFMSGGNALQTSITSFFKYIGQFWSKKII